MSIKANLHKVDVDKLEVDRLTHGTYVMRVYDNGISHFSIFFDDVVQLRTFATKLFNLADDARQVEEIRALV